MKRLILLGGGHACVAASGAAAPTWRMDSGLAADEQGFIRVPAVWRLRRYASAIFP